ncbi:hypothetical protein C4D60_Mb07t18980 [Musa balbisiana]|uniref:Galactose oxidase-like Early set domain-containing protein n=1 Tax=Musa balbisiana TaxID=52838 RepID=A0A4S8JGM4_MUSBA|nr:hypothetical protein C4D60_Mb07t18980 [Musa balbisiana]
MRSLPRHVPFPFFFFFFFFLILLLVVVSVAAGGGEWKLLQHSIGVSAMHMQLLHNDRVVVFDRTDFGPSNLSLPDGRCRNDPNDKALPVDCTAHSAEYDVVANAFRPLMILTDTWCSSGSVAPDGTLVQTGGFNDGERAARTFRPCDDGSCDWVETAQALAVRRWYATNQVLPDGRAVVVGGRRQFNYEFYPKPDPSDMSTIALRFLQDTRDDVEDNLYPFVHLSIDGNLFIFANNRAILLDYSKNTVVRTYPKMPSGEPRNYPSSGSSVLLPLKPSPTEAEVLICGGAPAGSYSQALAVRRWYATNQVLPDGRAVVVGGRRQFNYEFYPKPDPSDMSTIALRFLQDTRDDVEDNLYPFVHLSIDGNLFIFANNRAILLDYSKNTVVRTYPKMPSGEPRNYPSSGSSVLLPLKPSPTEAEVLICGGAPAGSYSQALQKKRFLRALDSCGRIKITDAAPSWSMEAMPVPRVMGDMVLLPDGDVLLINGAAAGTAGWELGHDPILTPVVYRPEGAAGARFDVQSASTTPRLYHSTAVLLRDGRVLVGGSNPHVKYNFSGVEYPTELSMEAFSPSYLSSENSRLRPQILTPPSPIQLTYGGRFSLQFSVGVVSEGGIRVTMVAPSFATHSFSMNQRLLVLETEGGTSEVVAVAPASDILAPPGYYMVYVVNGEVPSEGIWAHIQ